MLLETESLIRPQSIKNTDVKKLPQKLLLLTGSRNSVNLLLVAHKIHQILAEHGSCS